VEGGGCAFAPGGKECIHREHRSRAGDQRERKDFYARPDQSGAKPVAISTSKGGNFNPAYSPDGKWLRGVGGARGV